MRVGMKNQWADGIILLNFLSFFDISLDLRTKINQKFPENSWFKAFCFGMVLMITKRVEQKTLAKYLIV